MTTKPKFFLTTAIDYPNSRPHIGTAFEKLGADVQARYRRMEGFEVRFLMGNDENTVKVSKRAADLKQDTQAYCDDMAKQFQEVWLNVEGEVKTRSVEDYRQTENDMALALVLLGQKSADATSVLQRMTTRLQPYITSPSTNQYGVPVHCHGVHRGSNPAGGDCQIGAAAAGQPRGHAAGRGRAACDPLDGPDSPRSFDEQRHAHRLRGSQDPRSGARARREPDHVGRLSF